MSILSGFAASKATVSAHLGMASNMANGNDQAAQVGYITVAVGNMTLGKRSRSASSSTLAEEPAPKRNKRFTPDEIKAFAWKVYYDAYAQYEWEQVRNVAVHEWLRSNEPSGFETNAFKAWWESRRHDANFCQRAEDAFELKMPPTKGGRHFKPPQLTSAQQSVAQDYDARVMTVKSVIKAATAVIEAAGEPEELEGLRSAEELGIRDGDDRRARQILADLDAELERAPALISTLHGYAHIEARQGGRSSGRAKEPAAQQSSPSIPAEDDPVDSEEAPSSATSDDATSGTDQPQVSVDDLGQAFPRDRMTKKELTRLNRDLRALKQREGQREVLRSHGWDSSGKVDDTIRDLRASLPAFQREMAVKYGLAKGLSAQPAS